MHLNGHQVACYACEDRGTEGTQLAEALPTKDMDIARSFGMHPVSLSRFKAQARAEHVNNFGTLASCI